MANFFVKKDRNIIPNWRSFENTAKLGELNGSKNIKFDSSFKPDISDLLEDWTEFQTIGLAGDIIGTALVCNQESNAVVKEVSRFVLSNSELASKAMIEAANNVLKGKKAEIELNVDISKPEDFGTNTKLIEIYLKINALKKRIIKNPSNSILWIEIARYYSIIGNDKKAEKAVKNALYLSPENRFILRSAARFFVHIGDFDIAHDITRKSTLIKNDPWVMATEIAIATLRDRNSIFTKSGLQVVNSGNFHPFNISELASSVATVEMKNASFQKSKLLFNKSLINPNDNSLAQAEWASQEDKNLIHVNPEKFKVLNSFEAVARENFDRGNWQTSVDSSKDWFFDQPFSKLGLLFGNEVASRKLKDENQAVEIAKLGLFSHPNDPHLLNNIVYGLCVQDKTEEAESFFKRVRKEDFNSDSSSVYLTATKGLLNFRQGKFELGRQYYLDAINIAKEDKNIYYSSVAYINYLREEIRIGEDVSAGIAQLEKVIKTSENIDVISDAKEVLDLYKKTKKN